MSNEATTKTYDADKLVTVYIKMRDKRAELKRQFEEQDAVLESSMDAIEAELLEVCKRTGQDGGKTAHGTFSRTVRTRYWTSDWERMRQFIRTHDAIDLLEQRIHQTNMKAFLTENPDKVPEGLNVDSKYSIVVRRKSA